ncbi:MAG: transposase [Kiritimatiellae bacterium]|nr:transposase [Kiritimatiellia bacterium]MDD5522375.1 transposase [Kiritimatiellia bacterium]
MRINRASRGIKLVGRDRWARRVEMNKTLPFRKKLPHGRPPWINDRAIFFITICCRNKGKNQLCYVDVAEKIFESVRFRQERGDWFIYLFLLMPDHLHGLLSFPVDKAMKQTISKWKEYTAKQMGVFWQRDFFDHRLRSDESYEEKAFYIRMNPVRKNLVEKPENWNYVYESS